MPCAFVSCCWPACLPATAATMDSSDTFGAKVEADMQYVYLVRVVTSLNLQMKHHDARRRRYNDEKLKGATWDAVEGECEKRKIGTSL
ncbi:hypothetical protein DUNSADRAFT_10819 [Dunaliella salina]|uniref:MADF domain-containing protein n=1 Tax=Dunaliella salina TaxID=3046 RepID=A0ABQ7H9W4_DUNSA|nr:hypothetical protein DUNSADRAFT_10819 [Dunaliella salina]|eukprot:KAF5843644.1 hypothetical protein DUNSADRAFT_10819 [Dunaliella salina]